jgi:hypothetical protein
MFVSHSVWSTPKQLVSCGFAIALIAGVSAAPAGATSLADYYRTMYTMKFCSAAAETETEGEEASEADIEQEIRLPVDQEFIDAEATSEDVAPIFEQLNAEYNADPVGFCEQNTAAAQEVIEEVQ